MRLIAARPRAVTSTDAPSTVRAPNRSTKPPTTGRAQAESTMNTVTLSDRVLRLHARSCAIGCSRSPIAKRAPPLKRRTRKQTASRNRAAAAWFTSADLGRPGVTISRPSHPIPRRVRPEPRASLPHRPQPCSSSRPRAPCASASPHAPDATARPSLSHRHRALWRVCRGTLRAIACIETPVVGVRSTTDPSGCRASRSPRCRRVPPPARRR